MSRLLFVVVVCLIFAGCSDGVTWYSTVTDSNGNKHEDLIYNRHGTSWVEFKDKDGRLYVFYGDFNYTQEARVD